MTPFVHWGVPGESKLWDCSGGTPAQPRPLPPWPLLWHLLPVAQGTGKASEPPHKGLESKTGEASELQGAAGPGTGAAIGAGAAAGAEAGAGAGAGAAAAGVEAAKGAGAGAEAEARAGAGARLVPAAAVAPGSGPGGSGATAEGSSAGVESSRGPTEGLEIANGPLHRLYKEYHAAFGPQGNAAKCEDLWRQMAQQPLGAPLHYSYKEATLDVCGAAGPERGGFWRFDHTAMHTHTHTCNSDC